MIRTVQYRGYTLTFASRQGYWIAWRGDAMIETGFPNRESAQRFVDGLLCSHSPTCTAYRTDCIE